MPRVSHLYLHAHSSGGTAPSPTMKLSKKPETPRMRLEQFHAKPRRLVSLSLSRAGISACASELAATPCAKRALVHSCTSRDPFKCCSTRDPWIAWWAYLVQWLLRLAGWRRSPALPPASWHFVQAAPVSSSVPASSASAHGNSSCSSHSHWSGGPRSRLVREEEAPVHSKCGRTIQIVVSSRCRV